MLYFAAALSLNFYYCGSCLRLICCVNRSVVTRDPAKHNKVAHGITANAVAAMHTASSFASGIQTGNDISLRIPGLEFQLESMTIGSLLSLWFQTLVVGLTMNILSICIFLVTYGRMIEIYVVTALGPIPLATMGSSEWRSTGQNYLKSLLALGFQAFLIMIVVGIYAVLISRAKI